MLTTSESIALIAPALVKAQAGFTMARKDAYNPHFKSEFASLASVVGASRKSLTSNGLAVVQGVHSKGSLLTLTTRLLHESGEYLETSTEVSATGKNPVQALGSAITYLRRYAYTSLVGVVVEGDDDDAEEVENPPTPARAEPEAPLASVKWETTEQRRFFGRLGDIAPDLPYEDLAAWCEFHKRPRPSLMTDDQRDALLAWMDTGGGIAKVNKWVEGDEPPAGG